MKQIKIIFALVILSFGLNGQLRNCEYFRELKPAPETGFYDIKIGSAILDRGLDRFSQYREGFYRFYQLNEKDTIEIPYLVGTSRLDIYERKSFKDLKIIDKSYVTGKFSFATLIVDSNFIYSTVYLNFSEPSFFKDVTLEGSNDNKN